MKRNTLKFFVGASVLVILSCIVWANMFKPDRSSGRLEIDSDSAIVIPEGYAFFAATSYGNFAPIHTTIYCTEIETHRVFVCTDGMIDKEIIPPAGYRLVGVSEFGSHYGSVTRFYCQNQATGEVNICHKED